MNYLSQLQLYPNFSHIDLNKQIYYELVSHFNDYEKIENYFDLKIFSCIDDEIERLCYLKNMAKEVLTCRGNTLSERKYDHLNYLSIIEMANRNGDELNCRYKSFVFSQLLMACGFKSRWVGCLSMDIDDQECHCVTEVYLKKLKKWVAVDISFDYLYFDSKGMLLNLMEIRNNMVSGDKVKFISKNKSAALDTRRYLEKNLFMFRFLSFYKYNMTIDSAENVLLYPEHYCIDYCKTRKYSYITTNASPFW